jgi:hypothetical protein
MGCGRRFKKSHGHSAPNLSGRSPGATLTINQAQSPALSVILIVQDHYDPLAKTVEHLQAQTVRSQLEIVIVTKSADALRLNRNDFAMFCGVQVVTVGEMRSVGDAYAAGVRRSSAPIVVFGEDHCYPQPDWAEWLLRDHQQPWAAVGPVVHLANPERRTAVADFLLSYGEWSEVNKPGEVEHLPGHNSSYKRALLLEYGGELENWLRAESVLHWDLRRKGCRLFLEPAAKSTHVCFTHFPSFVHVQFLVGRDFAAMRARNERWPVSRRIAFSMAAPLIPFLRLKRILQKHHVSMSVLPAVFVALLADGFGQFLGYLLAQPSVELPKYELEREKFNHEQEARARTNRAAAG